MIPSIKQVHQFPPVALLTRLEIEDFLFREAELLDNWNLDDWLKLFTPDAVYEVPSTGSIGNVDVSQDLFYVADDYHRLNERVVRLKKPEAHIENPHSKTVHIISNVRAYSGDEVEYEVDANFVTYRTKWSETQTYFGRHKYKLRRVGDKLMIATKRSVLIMDNLRPQGVVSIIL